MKVSAHDTESNSYLHSDHLDALSPCAIAVQPVVQCPNYLYLTCVQYRTSPRPSARDRALANSVFRDEVKPPMALA